MSRFFLFLVALAPLVALACWLRLPESARFAYAAAAEYWIFPAIFAGYGLAAALWLGRGGRWPRPTARGAGLAVLAAALTITALSGVRPMRWQQWDETNLLATSVGMHEGHGNAFAYQTNLEAPAPLLEQDRRPPFFPFCVSLLHGLLGVNAANVFLLNALTLFACLCLFLALGTRSFGFWPALAGVFLWLSSPIVVWCASSGGFDLFSLFFLSLFLLTAAALTRAPSAPALFLYLGVGTLFCYTRYESVVIFGVVSAGVAWCTRRRFPRAALWPLALLPALFTPLALHILSGPTESTYARFYRELHAYFQAEPFRGRYILEHAPGFALAFFNPYPYALYFGWGNLVGVLAFGAWCWRARPRAPALWLTVAAVFTSLFLMLGFVFGGIEHFESLRLYLPAITAGAFAPLFLARLFPGRRTDWGLLAAAVAVFAVRYPATVSSRAACTSEMARLLDSLETSLFAAPLDFTHALFVFDAPKVFVLRNLRAVTPEYFRAHLAEARARLAAGEIRHVYLVDLYPPARRSSVQKLAEEFAAREVWAVPPVGASGTIFEITLGEEEAPK